jgi:hypothetical protein
MICRFAAWQELHAQYPNVSRQEFNQWNTQRYCPIPKRDQADRPVPKADEKWLERPTQPIELNAGSVAGLAEAIAKIDLKPASNAASDVNDTSKETRIAPGADDSSQERNAPGSSDTGEVRKDPAPAGQDAVIDPSPDPNSGPLQLPDGTDQSKGPLQVAPSPKETRAQEQARKNDVKTFVDNGGKIRVIKEPTELHHIATDKSQKYTPELEQLFEGAGLTLQSPINKISIEGHRGPHGPDYNVAVLQSLKRAVKGLTPHTPEYKEKFEEEMKKLRGDVATPGRYLNKLVTGK